MKNDLCVVCEELYNKEDVKFEGNKCQECIEETEEYWEAIWHNIAEAEATGN